MNILFVSRDLIAANIAYLLQMEGCDVKLFIEVQKRRCNFEKLVKKTNNWKKELSWVGKGGLIIFDDVGYGREQDELRRQGYSVFGGTALGDKLEEDRGWAQKIFEKCGLKSLPTHNFENVEATIRFLKYHKGPWVIKQNGYHPKDINYVGHFSDNRDAIAVLRNYQQHHDSDLGVITLQKRAIGVEIGIGRYFNGDDWVGPIEINVEHKKLFPGDLGPATTEMGTLAWYDEDESNALFRGSLAKLKPFLREIDFRGDIDIGCIVNKEGIYPLEATPRLGTPIVHLHTELHSSPWHTFLKAIADKRPFKLKWKKGFGIVVLISLPPFPYNRNICGVSPLGLEVSFDSSMTNNDFQHIHFEGVSVTSRKQIFKSMRITDHLGYVLYVTALGNNIRAARKKAQGIIDKIYIPKMLYRNDIGMSFESKGLHDLKKWGYIKL